MLFGNVGTSLLGNMLERKGMWRAGYGSSIKFFLIPFHPLTNVETIIRMNLEAIEFILEIACLKEWRMGHM